VPPATLLLRDRLRIWSRASFALLASASPPRLLNTFAGWVLCSLLPICIYYESTLINPSSLLHSTYHLPPVVRMLPLCSCFLSLLLLLACPPSAISNLLSLSAPSAASLVFALLCCLFYAVLLCPPPPLPVHTVHPCI
jgi:hypothetical protein